MVVVNYDRKVISDLCIELNTARSLSVFLHLKYCSDREIVAYLKAGIRPESYSCAETFSKDYLVISILSKWRGFKTGDDLANIALNGWTTDESLNKLTNIRLKSAASNSRVEAILFMAQRKIADILGVCPSYDLLWTDFCQWSGGGTVDLRRGTTAPEKMSSRMTVTSNAFVWISHVLGHDPHWCEANHLTLSGPCCILPSEFTLVRGGSFMTVPKDASTDRTIEKQPTGNIFLQKGVGSIIRNRLKRFGVDLDDQTKNQKLASYAERLNLATIDLKSASNSVTSRLVETLLPLDWWLFLNSLRTHNCELPDGSVRRLEMFSSMGNGFTFELESLLFYGILHAVTSELGLADFYNAVYGDDIICPSEAAPLLITVLNHCGFRVNEKKSYCFGSFYESCGKHYFHGVEVTPAYQKLTTSDGTDTAEVIRLHNRLFRWSMRTGIGLPRTLALLTATVETNTRELNKRLRNSNNVRSRRKSFGTPRIPFYRTDDRGLLSPLSYFSKRHSSHGYLCTVIHAVSRYRRSQEGHFFALALRFSFLGMKPPDGFSSDSRGHAQLTDPDVKYRYTTAYIPFEE